MGPRSRGEGGGNVERDGYGGEGGGVWEGEGEGVGGVGGGVGGVGDVAVCGAEGWGEGLSEGEGGFWGVGVKGGEGREWMWIGIEVCIYFSSYRGEVSGSFKERQVAL